MYDENEKYLIYVPDIIFYVRVSKAAEYYGIRFIWKGTVGNAYFYLLIANI